MNVLIKNVSVVMLSSPEKYAFLFHILQGLHRRLNICTYLKTSTESSENRKETARMDKNTKKVCGEILQ
jgi:hypothetical protein